MAKATRTIRTTIAIATTNSSRSHSCGVQQRRLGFIAHWLTICLVCGTTFDCFVNCQIDEGQEALHKYQELQYQIQQQQQLQYQQQMQQQQQYHYLQQQQQQQQHEQHQQTQPQEREREREREREQQHPHPHLLPTKPLQLERNQQNDNEASQMQMLKTGASLVVAADGLGEAEEEVFYSQDDLKQVATRRSGTTSGRKRKRRPQAGDESGGENEYKQYWRGRVDDEVAPSSASVRDDSKLRRRKQPAVREPLAALEKEQKLFELRDRQRQEHGVAVSGRNRDKSYRKPYAQAKKEQESVTPDTPISAVGGTRVSTDLKHILKNSGGLSLSEILQQKNLSLDDLLKGKQNALLALQTTAASPSHGGGTSSQKPDGVKSFKPARRIPSAYLSTDSTELETSAEPSSNEEASLTRNKLKFPTLQRVKLFGSSSRATSTPILSGGDASTRRREPSFSTTSTTTSTTTTRLPLYKKRAQQRSTLKPPLLFKSTTIATIIETPINKEESTIKETLPPIQMSATNEPSTTTKLWNEDGDSQNIDNVEMDYTTVSRMANDGDSATESETVIMTTVTDSTEHSGTSTTSTTTTVIPTTVRRRSSTTTTNAPNSNSRSTRLHTYPKSRSKSKYRERYNENNLRSNSIESNEQHSSQAPPRQQSAEIDEVENNSAEQDDLENFFENISQKSSKEEAGNVTTLPNTPVRNDQSSKNRGTRPILTSTATTFSSTASSREESIPDFDGIDDRTDLLELIEDRRSGNRLFKVLQQRNMTLDELIEHRKRGSSQLHLATIVQENARSQFFPGQKVVLHDNMDIVTAFENFPHFNLLNLKSVKPDDIKTDSQGSSYFTSIIDIEPTDEIFKDTRGGGDIRGPTYTQQSQRNEKSLGFFPSWKSLALASLTSTTKGNPFFLPQPKLLLDEDRSSEELIKESLLSSSNETSASTEQLPHPITKVDVSAESSADETAEAIENEVARAHDLLDLELSGHAFKRSPAAASMMKQQQSGTNNLYANMPAGIRSAVVASAAIVLTSMTTFLVIFVVCRLKQRKRSKNNYLRSYNAMKSKMPTTSTTAPATATAMLTTTTTALNKMSTTSASNSRRSSLRNSRSIEDIIGVNSGAIGGNGVNGQLTHISTISTVANQQSQHRSNELLYSSRRDSNSNTNINSNDGKAMNQHSIKFCTKNRLHGRRNSNLAGADELRNNNGGFGSITGSTSSLALSLRSAHNISSSKLNTMDPNSPEVQEYLFDTLRKSFH